mmetsp:Transcript_3009/g.4907  ORF Transcript_3009/g.4907 Transcript_3009/m.4907 type:complete len:569 (+) Transcript_3009:152-1858(+)
MGLPRRRSRSLAGLVLFSLSLLSAVVLASSSSSQLVHHDVYDAPLLRRRVILRYKNGTRQACLEELAAISQHYTTTTNHDLLHHEFPTLNAFVLTMADDEIEKLRIATTSNFVGIEDDVPRYIDATLYDDAQHEEQEQQPSHLVRRRTKNNDKNQLPYGVDRVQAPQAWKLGAIGRHVKVCVIDTGVDGTHPDLLVGEQLRGLTNPTNPWNLDAIGHGTHMAGILVGTQLGVAPEAQVLSVNVFGSELQHTHASTIVAAALACADLGANIISLSLGGALPSPLEEQVLQQLYDEFGIISVAAAGNAGNHDYTYPASYAQVISVAAVDETNRVAPFSQANAQVDISAPGVNIISSLPVREPCLLCNAMGAHQYGRLSGTSVAVPHVSGVLALLKSYQPQATAAELVEALYASAQDLGAPGRDNHYGRGLVQALTGMEHLDGLLDCQDDVVTPNTAGRCPIPGQVPIDLVIKTDWHPEETSFDLVRWSDQETIWRYSNLLSHRRFHFDTCVMDDECLVLSIHDSAGDGLCCTSGLGGYQVFYNSLEVTKGEVFNDLVTVYLGECTGHQTL